MGSEWTEEYLEDLAEEITVGFVGSMTSEYMEDGVPFLRSKNVDPLIINTDDIKFISHEFDQKIAKSHLQPGDVVIVRTGKPGTCAVIPQWLKQANCSDLVIVRCNSKIDSHFLAYYVNEAAAGHVNAHLVGAVQQHFNVASARKLQVRLPPLTEQARIVSVLRAFDKKIELNRQTNQTLESMAQTLFKSWFVDFDPVIDNALAAGNEIPEPLAAKAAARRALQEQGTDKANQPHTLPDSIRQLFPSRFQFTEELGWIPAGWEKKRADEISTVSIGKTPPRKQSEWFRKEEKGNIAWLSIRDLGRQQIFHCDSSEFLTPEAVDRFNVKTVPPRTVFLSFKLTLGRIGISSTRLATNEAIAHFSSAVLPNEYLYCYFRSFDFNSLGSTSSIATAVNSKIIKAMPVLAPTNDVVDEFIKMCQPIFSRIEKTERNASALTKLRDSLLPKLLSGELRIPEAEEMLDEALA